MIGMTAESELVNRLRGIQGENCLLQRLVAISADSTTACLINSNLSAAAVNNNFEKLLKTTMEAIQNE